MNFKKMMIIGATFGVFLTNATAWSSLIKALVNTVVPGEDDSILKLSINAIALTCISIPALCFILKINLMIEKRFKKSNPRQILTKNMQTLKKTSQR
jgi:hypothetical protein